MAGSLDGAGRGIVSETVSAWAMVWMIGGLSLGLPALVIVIPHLGAWRATLRFVRRRSIVAGRSVVPGG